MRYERLHDTICKEYQRNPTMTRHGIERGSEETKAFCRKWKIKELSVFGSYLRDDFKSDSDIDFLFVLEVGIQLSIESWIAMEDELNTIIGRKVDLVPRKSVEESDNYIRRRHILSSAEAIYAQR